MTGFAGRLAALAMMGALIAPGAGWAHTEKERTRPADGAVLSESPPVIVIDFDGPMRLTYIALGDADGRDFELERTDGMAPVTRFEAVPPELPAGAYAVDWRGLAEDGHPMEGGFAFTIE